MSKNLGLILAAAAAGVAGLVAGFNYGTCYGISLASQLPEEELAKVREAVKAVKDSKTASLAKEEKVEG